jgi:lipopolysaccharide/colanic/teichoic acid biosynthesis glycosyltransferase
VDVAAAVVLLVALSPLLAAVAVLVRATSPGPAIYRQTRLGQDEQPFEMLKFRTMVQDAPDGLHREFIGRMLAGEDPRGGGSGALFKLEQDPRVTPTGRWLRRTSLDELPQLINVLRGEMALVGPRPTLPWEVELFTSAQRRRFEVKPGITGLWQVSGRSRLTMTEALALDLEYVQTRSLLTDLSILAKTIPTVLQGAAR